MLDFSAASLQLGAGDSSGSERCIQCALSGQGLLASFTLTTIALRRLIEPGCVVQRGEEVNGIKWAAWPSSNLSCNY